LWGFFPFGELNNLVFASGINTVRLQTVPGRYAEQQQLLGDGAEGSLPGSSGLAGAANAGVTL